MRMRPRTPVYEPFYATHPLQADANYMPAAQVQADHGSFFEYLKFFGKRVSWALILHTRFRL